MTNTLCLILDNRISEAEILCGISNLLWILPEGELCEVSFTRSMQIHIRISESWGVDPCLESAI